MRKATFDDNGPADALVVRGPAVNGIGRRDGAIHERPALIAGL